MNRFKVPLNKINISIKMINFVKITPYDLIETIVIIDRDRKRFLNLTWFDKYQYHYETVNVRKYIVHKRAKDRNRVESNRIPMDFHRQICEGIRLTS